MTGEGVGVLVAVLAAVGVPVGLAGLVDVGAGLPVTVSTAAGVAPPVVLGVRVRAGSPTSMEVALGEFTATLTGVSVGPAGEIVAVSVGVAVDQNGSCAATGSSTLKETSPCDSSSPPKVSGYNSWSRRISSTISGLTGAMMIKGQGS